MIVSAKDDQAVEAEIGRKSVNWKTYLSLAPRRKNVTCEMAVRVVLLAVGFEEGLHVMPCTLDCISVITGFGLEERNGVIRGAMRVTLGRDIPIRKPSLMSVVPGSIHSQITLVSVLAVLSGTGRRSVLPDSRSTPPNTRWPFTVCPLWYFRRPNLLSCISTVLLGPPSFSQQPSKYTSIVSLQNIPHSAIVWLLKWCSRSIRWAGSQCKMSNVRYRTSWRMTPLEQRPMPYEPRCRAPGSTKHLLWKNLGSRSYHDSRRYTAYYCELTRRP